MKDPSFCPVTKSCSFVQSGTGESAHEVMASPCRDCRGSPRASMSPFGLKSVRASEEHTKILLECSQIATSAIAVLSGSSICRIKDIVTRSHRMHSPAEEPLTIRENFLDIDMHLIRRECPQRTCRRISLCDLGPFGADHTRMTPSLPPEHIVFRSTGRTHVILPWCKPSNTTSRSTEPTCPGAGAAAAAALAGPPLATTVAAPPAESNGTSSSESLYQLQDRSREFVYTVQPFAHAAGDALFSERIWPTEQGIEDAASGDESKRSGPLLRVITTELCTGECMVRFTGCGRLKS
mmetsp:Transcript_5922/g.15079  ORF Transcript_5922/g.15079 Transcript_5922/m.15079 type:complete len:294 (+) Transcript_5922:571-1452(+)